MVQKPVGRQCFALTEPEPGGCQFDIFLPAGDLGRIQGIETWADGVKRLAVGREFDLLGKMLHLQSTPSSGPAMWVTDAYGNLNQREQTVRGDSSYWRYSFEAFGQVADALKTDSGSVAFPGFGYAFNYDTIGNRLSVAENEELTEYISNALNQYTLITLPAPEPAQIPTYDLNGNMTHTGRDAYLWDEENRLVRMEYPDGSASEFDYDGLSRRMERREYDASGSLTETMRYVYDELLPIQELDGNHTVGRSYTRGLDLTQSLQGAGGVGGLLAMTESSGATFFYFYDGNGNVTDLIDDTDAPAAHYEYDPFGKVIAQTGTLDQPFQFSTKAYHAPSGLNHYLYRWYSPEMGRWPNRDPIGERGGANLYGFVNNASIAQIDIFGLLFGHKTFKKGHFKCTVRPYGNAFWDDWYYDAGINGQGYYAIRPNVLNRASTLASNIGGPTWIGTLGTAVSLSNPTTYWLLHLQYQQQKKTAHVTCVRFCRPLASYGYKTTILTGKTRRLPVWIRPLITVPPFMQVGPAPISA